MRDDGLAQNGRALFEAQGRQFEEAAKGTLLAVKLSKSPDDDGLITFR
ncbi:MULTISPECIES: hypothetical protein [Acidithrix]|nr:MULTISPECIES: hypothetical protein [Acidithrix]CAG4931419.1 unnamed protein product [Acidithrix sp. C25]